MPTLSSGHVETVFHACLFDDGVETSSAVIVEGIMTNVGFDPARLAVHTNEIIELLGYLPDSFKVSGGGGMSFLNACEDRNGHLWTGSHAVMEQLMLLGMAIGTVTMPLPRELWSVLPGGMPYFIINDQ